MKNYHRELGNGLVAFVRRIDSSTEFHTSQTKSYPLHLCPSDLKIDSPYLDLLRAFKIIAINSTLLWWCCLSRWLFWTFSSWQTQNRKSTPIEREYRFSFSSSISAESIPGLYESCTHNLVLFSQYHKMNIPTNNQSQSERKQKTITGTKLLCATKVSIWSIWKHFLQLCWERLLS